ncbi:MAG: hypothetical protein KAH84_04505 [Thiomargarita sp.]|nr:hypothetical protein [Thiomargarita sp.]
MLIFLTDNILKTTPEYSEFRLIVCLENLLIAYFEGKHILIAESRTISNYQKIAKLSERAKASLDKIKKFVRKGGLDIKNEFPFYIQIVYARKSKITINKTIINIPIWYFEDSNAIQETIILGEHINDARFFYQLAYAYLTTKKKLKTAQIKIRAKPIHGGGSSTNDVLHTKCKDNTLCLCIVDTDCKAPNTKFGNTAKSLGLSQNKQQEWQNISKQSDNSITIEKNSALAKAFAINVHEIENLIPTCLIESSLPKNSPDNIFDKIDILKKWEQNDANEWRKFIDMKNGLRCYDIQTFKYWKKFIQTSSKNECNECEKKTDCNIIFWEGLGNKVLAQVIEYMDKKTPHKIAEFFDFNDNSLVKLSYELLTWCCASERIRY